MDESDLFGEDTGKKHAGNAPDAMGGKYIQGIIHTPA